MTKRFDLSDGISILEVRCPILPPLHGSFSRFLAARDPLTTGKIEARAPTCTRPISFSLSLSLFSRIHIMAARSARCPDHRLPVETPAVLHGL